MKKPPLKEKVLGEVKAGQCVSFPVPAFNSEHVLVDMFFVYTVDQNTRIPNEPMYCPEYGRSTDAFTKVDSSMYFKDIVYAPTPFEMPVNYEQIANEIWDMYEDVRTEVLGGVEDVMVEKYVELVFQATQKCLMPYCSALAREVFE